MSEKTIKTVTTDVKHDSKPIPKPDPNHPGRFTGINVEKAFYMAPTVDSAIVPAAEKPNSESGAGKK